jgi:hypothetical protein
MVRAPSLSDLLSSYSAVRSKSLTLPMPSQRGHMPPRLNVAFCTALVLLPRFDGDCAAGLARRDVEGVGIGRPDVGPAQPAEEDPQHRVGVGGGATVERGLAPIRSWSTMIAVVSPSSKSTSGRDSVGMKPCTNAL